MQPVSLDADQRITLATNRRNWLASDACGELFSQTEDGQVVRRYSNRKFLGAVNLAVAKNLVFSYRQMELRCKKTVLLLFPGTRPEEAAGCPRSRPLDLDRESIWISYCPMRSGDSGPNRFGQFSSHHRLATPVSPWERLKIGGGTPPILTRHGWLIIYHGVRDLAAPQNEVHQLCYSAGVMVLSKKHPLVIRYRSEDPVLEPELPQERSGTVADVVFPTGIDRRDDLGCPDRFDVYYGMADRRIGVARLDVPESLPQGGSADPPQARV